MTKQTTKQTVADIRHTMDAKGFITMTLTVNGKFRKSCAITPKNDETFRVDGNGQSVICATRLAAIDAALAILRTVKGGKTATVHPCEYTGFILSAARVPTYVNLNTRHNTLYA